MIIKAFKMSHLDGVELETEGVGNVGIINDLAKHPSVTMVVDDKIIGFAGMVKNGMDGMVWMIPTVEMKKHKKELVKLMKMYVQNLDKLYNVNRLVTENCGGKRIHRWLTYLGFTPCENGLYERRM